MTTSSLQFSVAGLTHKGMVRAHNEDSICVLTEIGLWAVADGMGGHSAGDVASGIIAEELGSTGVAISAQDQRARVLERLDRAHRRIRDHAAANNLRTVGATTAALLIHESQLSCIWAGDSRIYLSRDGELTRLTRDHSEVAQYVAAGMMTESEARTAPRRNVITRAIGIGEEAQPEMVTGPAKPGDRLLICSDGLTEHVEDAELADVLADTMPVANVADWLLSETLRRGAKDNVSVIVVEFHGADDPDTRDVWTE